MILSSVIAIQVRFFLGSLLILNPDQRSWFVLYASSSSLERKSLFPYFLCKVRGSSENSIAVMVASPT